MRHRSGQSDSAARAREGQADLKLLREISRWTYGGGTDAALRRQVAARWPYQRLRSAGAGQPNTARRTRGELP